MSDRARILFVDDEKRVLNSMRGMFRREFDLFLTTEGATAVRMALENPIDVIVADQRMPGMTGIEVLEQVREFSPNTIRILLTGYADPSAVADSINVGEVFRFLGKPCPPKLLRETLKLAVTATRTVHQSSRTEATTPAAAQIEENRSRQPGQDAALPNAAPRVFHRVALPARTDEHRDARRGRSAPSTGDIQEIPQYGNEDALARWHSMTRAALAANIHKSSHDGSVKTRITAPAREVGVVVYTVDAQFAETAIRALSTERSTTLATSFMKMQQAIEQDMTGVLIADITSNNARMLRVIAALKRYRPELVTIVISDSRDTTDMVKLINFGQAFRHCAKPVTSKQLRNVVDEAAVKHLDLVNDPKSINRHAVAEFPIQPDTSTGLDKLLSRIRDRRSPLAIARDGSV